MTSHPTKDVPYAPGPWITSVVLHDDGPATYAVHKRETAPDLVADYIKDEETARLIATAPDMLKLLRDINEAFYVHGTRKALLPVMQRTKPLIQKARGEP
jgi:hypothetical protein